MTHFTDAELAQWRESGPGESRHRAFEHLQGCAACAARYAEAIRTRPLAAPLTAVDDLDEFLEAGYSAPSPRARAVPRLVRRLGRWLRPPAGHWRWVVPVSAATAVLIAVLVPQLMRRDADTELHFRGAHVQPLSPAGSVEGPLEFTWSTGLAVSRYRLEIGSADAVISSVETNRPPWTMGSELRQRLSPGLPYWWTVTALDAEGRAIQTSSRQTFTLR